MTYGQPSPWALAQARKQVQERWTARVRIMRRSGDPVEVPGTLDVEIPQTLVYEGVARLSLATSSETQREDESQYAYRASLLLPFEVDGTVLMPVVKDLVLVLEHPDPELVRTSSRITSVSTGGQLQVFRQCEVQGTAISEDWFDATPTPVVGP